MTVRGYRFPSLLHVPLGILPVVEVIFPVCAVMERVTIVTHQHTSTMQFSVHSVSLQGPVFCLAVLSSQLELQMPCRVSHHLSLYGCASSSVLAPDGPEDQGCGSAVEHLPDAQGAGIDLCAAKVIKRKN